MESELHGIGEIARRSGLTVSALRFYDGIGVLVPIEVDERSGYRRYSDEQIGLARLLARLRRVAMPIDDIRRVLAARHQPELAGTFLDAHLRRLEKGVADARRELSAARELINSEESLMSTSITVASLELAAELAAVRFAASTDPELDVLRGVLLEADAETGRLKMVATDRYRLVLCSVPAAIDGPSAQRVVASADVDRIIDALSGVDGPARIGFGADRVTLDAGDHQVIATPIEGAYPEYQRLIPASGRIAVQLDEVLVNGFQQDTGRRLSRHQDDQEFALTVLAVGPDGQVRTLSTPEDAGTGSEELIGVNQEFLLEAMNALAGDQLRLELDGPLTPLVLRSADRADTLSLVMPVRIP